MKKLILPFIIIFATVFLCTAQEISFEQHVVTDDFTNGYDVYPADIDQDGFIDILACGKGNGGQVCYWLNDGSCNFTKTTLKQGFTGARTVRAADINGDQNIDIVSAAWQANDIILFKSDGYGGYTEIMIDNNFIGAHTIDLKDLNGDNALDILCSGFDYYGHEGEIAWWENGGQDSIIWTKHLISDRFQQSPFIYGEDMDNDGDIDVIACGEINNEIYWWENDGSGDFINEFEIDDSFYSAHTVLAKDIDMDGDQDILAAGCMNTKLAWYENDGMQNFNKHNLAPVGGDLWLDAADLDLDGDIDLVAAGMSASKIKWYENDGSQQFTKNDVDGGFSSGFVVIPLNMDADGDVDLLAIGYSSGMISWFENNADSTTDIGELQNNTRESFLVYPNPCNEYLCIEDSFHRMKEISIFNASGKELRSLKSIDRETHIWLGNMPKGLLVVKVNHGSSACSSYKVLKQ